MRDLSSLTDYFKAKNSKLLLNIILDGFGDGPKDKTNAIYQAKTPFIDSLLQNYASTRLFTHGHHVGLPSDKDMGGSEVGHLTIGAGILTSQGSKLISEAIDSGEFEKIPLLRELMNQAKETSLHLIGLLSDGNIHSHMSHLEAFVKEAAKQNVKKVYLHALLDGRDVPIQSADEYVIKIESLFKEILKSNSDFDYRIVSGGGREHITMDRANNWDKVELGWQTHVEANSGNIFSSALEAIQYFRSQNPDLVDQDMPPFNISDSKNPPVKINDGDVVVCFNFRGDRAIEITRAFCEENFDRFSISRRPKVLYAGMMVYDEDTNSPKNRLFVGPKIKNPFGKRILEMGHNQFRLSETQKFPHVTFFFNGGYRLPLDPAKEDYILIDSDVIPSFAMKPKMKALEITEKLLELIQAGKHRYGLINFPNPDMVGHTGDMDAVIEAVETLDKCLERICSALKANNGLAVITADHGNADEMLILNKKNNVYEKSTKHSLNPVPFIVFDPDFKGNYSLKPLDDEPNLSMIAATNFILMGEPCPDDLSPPLFLC